MAEIFSVYKRRVDARSLNSFLHCNEVQGIILRVWFNHLMPKTSVSGAVFLYWNCPVLPVNSFAQWTLAIVQYCSVCALYLDIRSEYRVEPLEVEIRYSRYLFRFLFPMFSEDIYLAIHQLWYHLSDITCDSSCLENIILMGLYIIYKRYHAIKISIVAVRTYMYIRWYTSPCHSA